MALTFTMPDTPSNQAEYPQSPSQTKASVSHCPGLRDCFAGHRLRDGLGHRPYAGKETGETALLREMLGSFAAGDIMVADRFYCSFNDDRLANGQGRLIVVPECTNGASRRFSTRKAAGQVRPSDRVHKPERPEWMDEDTYAAIPT